MGVGRVFLFFFLFAVLEAMVMAKVADHIGWLAAILAMVVMAMLGSLLFRMQGLSTWLRLNQRLQQGEMPGAELVESFLLLLGGVLLVTPGFITDAFGLVLLIPPLRKGLAAFIARKGMLQAVVPRPGQGGAFVYTRTTYRDVNEPPARAPIRESSDGHLIIDGQAERKDD